MRKLQDHLNYLTVKSLQRSSILHIALIQKTVQFVDQNQNNPVNLPVCHANRGQVVHEPRDFLLPPEVAKATTLSLKDFNLVITRMYDSKVSSVA